MGPGLPPEVKKAFDEHFAPRMFDLVVIADGIIERFVRKKTKGRRSVKTDFRDRMIVAQMLITMSMQGALATIADASAPAEVAVQPFRETTPERIEDIRKAFLNKMLERNVNFTSWKGAEETLVGTDEGYRLLTALLPAAAGAAVERERKGK